MTLRVDLFGDFGYHDLYKQFERAHPGVTIKEDIESYADHHANLAKHLATGAGADDVVAIEVGFIAQFKAQPQNFVDLNQYGASKLKSQWLPWKWAQSIAPNGAQIGLGTDVGSMGICYRRDLMQAAGLPTSRDAVSKLWPTGRLHQTGEVQEGAEGTFFFDRAQRLQRDDRAAEPGLLRHAQDVIVEPRQSSRPGHDDEGIAKGESAGLAAFSTSWNTGFQRVTSQRSRARLDDGLHPGTGSEDRGRLGHRSRPGRRGSWAARSCIPSSRRTPTCLPAGQVP